MFHVRVKYMCRFETRIFWNFVFVYCFILRVPNTNHIKRAQSFARLHTQTHPKVQNITQWNTKNNAHKIWFWVKISKYGVDSNLCILVVQIHVDVTRVCVQVRRVRQCAWKIRRNNNKKDEIHIETEKYVFVLTVAAFLYMSMCISS